jgi:P-type Cu+ transporter
MLLTDETRLTDRPPTRPRAACFHCGEECDDGALTAHGKAFCCAGCRTVYELLQENNLCAYYDLDARPGVSLKQSRPARFEYLDDASVRRALIQFSDGTIAKTTFCLPNIHCASCVWLLENLHKLNRSILRTEVNFLKKEVAVTFREREVSLGEVAGLLAKIGYEPEIRLGQVTAARRGGGPTNSRLYLKVGLAGFAFGNVMLFAFPDYLDTTGVLGAQFKALFAWLSVALATPVLLFSASDYFTGAWRALRQRAVSLDVPVALGIAALYARSLFDITTGRGTGYLDSFTGLVFFLLVGRIFQQKTFDALKFDRDYASYFPLSVTRVGRVAGREEERAVPVTQLAAGDQIFVRHGELVPADSVLISPRAEIDYSFVTGESEPVGVEGGALVYAGGRVVGAGARFAVEKQVSHGYLTQLWNNDAFRKEKRSSLADVADAFGKYFTVVVSALAAATFLFWLPDYERAVDAFTAVLIVACPCALTLAAPFTLGAAVTIFGKAKFYLKNVGVVLDLAKLDALVFDKTGTLTRAGRAEVKFEGEPLREEETAVIAACLKHSTHPLSRQILASLGEPPALEVRRFREMTNRGIEGEVGGRRVALGSPLWIKERTRRQLLPRDAASSVHVAIDGAYRGCFRVGNVYREGLGALFAALRPTRELYLLSGDNGRERAALGPLFKDDGRVAFHQSPEDKLRFVERLQAAGLTVGMVGDGLNDAGALRQSHVGIALAEDTAAFTPACDAILAAEKLNRLPAYLNFARYARRVLVASFLLSVVYNAVGLTLAVTGALTPLVAAVFMPLSSWSVVAVAWGAMKLREREIVNGAR